MITFRFNGDLPQMLNIMRLQYQSLNTAESMYIPTYPQIRYILTQGVPSSGRQTILSKVRRRKFQRKKVRVKGFNKTRTLSKREIDNFMKQYGWESESQIFAGTMKVV